MRTININQPRKLFIGEGSIDQLVNDLVVTGVKKVFVLADVHVINRVEDGFEKLKESGVELEIYQCDGNEPSFAVTQKSRNAAEQFQAQCVIGVGGGSVLDQAKLVAGLMGDDRPIAFFVGNGLVKERKVAFYCVPTTSGAGSESSPNAILIDDNNQKKAVIDPALIADGVYIDPNLLSSLPPTITAYTGLDALTHCIEAYANKNAHPVIDVYALEGIRLISQNLGTAIKQGTNLEAREKVALGAYYGGLCLGPVNTAAVHALAYPLGTKYKIAHGLSNALLLPFVLEFNLDSAEDRYANIAIAMGGVEQRSERETALQGIELVRKFISDCGMPSRLSELDIERSSVGDMAQDAMKIQRLLKNNVREVHEQDAVSIYENAF